MAMVWAGDVGIIPWELVGDGEVNHVRDLDIDKPRCSVLVPRCIKIDDSTRRAQQEPEGDEWGNINRPSPRPAEAK